MHLLISRTLSSALLILAVATAAPSAAQSRIGSCNLTVFELSFGVYDVFESGPTRAVTRVLVDCRGAASKIRPRIELSAGSSQDFAQRTQRAGVKVLTYNIYADAALTQVAGDGSSGTTALFPRLIGGGGGGGGISKVDLYGAIEPRQFVPPGAYFDTVYVTLIF
jgi:spore coat protein U-like protein